MSVQTLKDGPLMETKTLRQLPRYKTNPLIVTRELRLRKQKRVMTGRDVSDLAADTTIVTEEFVDSQTFVKIFDAGVRAAYELSNPAFKVFQLVLSLVSKGRMNGDSVLLHPSLIDEGPMKMSPQTYWRGMRELSEKGFIAASTVPSQYWINPHFFCKGDVYTIVSRYHRTTKARAIEQTTAINSKRVPPSLFDGDSSEDAGVME